MTNIETTEPAQRQAKLLFDNYEMHGCRQYEVGTPQAHTEQCPDDEAEFWTLYGHITGEGVQAIGDFQSRELAEQIYYRITGIPYSERDIRFGIRGYPLYKATLDVYLVAPTPSDARWVCHNICKELYDYWPEIHGAGMVEIDEEPETASDPVAM